MSRCLNCARIDRRSQNEVLVDRVERIAIVAVRAGVLLGREDDMGVVMH